jgi:hypothetical protein
VGLEGLWGLLILVISLPIIQNSQCSGRWVVEDSLQAVQDYRNNQILALEACLIMITYAGINLTSLFIKAHAQRSTIDICRTLLVWLFFLSSGREKFVAT